MAITLGLVEAIDSNGVYVSMPGSRGVLRGPYRALASVVPGLSVLVALTDDGEQVVVGAAPSHDGVYDAASFGAKGDGVTDDTAALQALLDGAAGAVALIPPGDYILSQTLVVPEETELRMHNGAVLLPQDPEVTCMTLDRGSVLQGGEIRSPEWWDGTNSAWDYAVVWAIDDDVTVRDLTLTNIPRVGIAVREGDNVLISGCRLHGNYPIDDYTGVETVGFGICQDTKSSTANGNLVITGNYFADCITGVFSANLGTGAPGRGLTISGNTFSGCIDHGVYVAQGEGYTITGNSFNRCRAAVAITGSYHTVTGNAITTGESGTARDVAGISVRDPIGCVVSNNTLIGEGQDGGTMLNVTELGGTTCVDNIITGNTVVNTGSGSAHAIRCGSGDATTFHGNVIANNVVRGTARAYEGLIHSAADPAGDAVGVSVTGNVVVLTGGEAGNGIHVIDQIGPRICGNEVRLERDADSAESSAMVVVEDCTGALVAHNRLVVTADWGDNVQVFGVFEAGSNAQARIERNVHEYDTTKIISATPLYLTSGSGALVDETGQGAPSIAAAVGSLWRRTDGGSSTTLYVKESGTDATGWVGK